MSAQPVEHITEQTVPATDLVPGDRLPRYFDAEVIGVYLYDLYVAVVVRPSHGVPTIRNWDNDHDVTIAPRTSEPSAATRARVIRVA